MIIVKEKKSVPHAEDSEKENKIEILANIIFNAAKHGYMPYDTQDEYCAIEIAKKNIDKFIVSKKQEDPISEDLEEAAEEWDESLYRSDAFKAGAKWQEKKNQSIIELAEDHAMLAGMKKMEEQMMAKAIDGKVIANGMGNPILHLWDKGRHLIGKKVKVIVVGTDLEPIPLTPEILEKNGFEYKEGEFDMCGIPIAPHYVHNDVPFEIFCDGEPFAIWFKEPINIKYVHQLQHALRLCGIKKEIMS